MKNTITIGILMLLLASGFVFVSWDRADDGIKIMSEDDYDYEIGYDDEITKESLRELDRINRKLGVNPDDLANPKSREVSQQARDFAEKEKLLEVLVVGK